MTIVLGRKYKGTHFNRDTLFIPFKTSITIVGSEGRVVNIYEVPTNASNDDLLEYKNQSTLDDNTIDEECCWGVAYKISNEKWEEEGIQLKVEDKNPGGFVSTNKTFYPVVS